MGRKAFIIGNGFDLDLGWPTSYHAFYEYEFGPISELKLNSEQQSVLERISENTKGKDSLLFRVLKKYSKIDKWMSLENVIMNYYLTKSAIIQGRECDDDNDMKKMFQTIDNISKELNLTDVVSETVDNNDKSYFDTLKQDLTTYLNYATNLPVNFDSIASSVFRLISNNGNFTFFDFNYTNLDYVFKLKLRESGINARFNGFNNLHGNLNAGIILGIYEGIEVAERYEYIHKHVDNHIVNIDLQSVLQEADEVIFFGHSFGKSDFNYFNNFFESQARSDKSGEKPVHISIFTYNEESKNEIRNNLINHLQDDKYKRMVHNTDFNIFCTSELKNCNELFKRLLSDTLT